VSHTLHNRVTETLSRPLRPEVKAYAQRLGEETGAMAVLFYGSNLRTGSLEGVLDFYVLLPGKQRERVWPRVSYRELNYEGETLRAKIATMSLEKFAEAASGNSRDTTIWTRFVQPSALAWSRDNETVGIVSDAIAEAACTASRYAAVLGPDAGRAEDYWRALFRATYRAEFRVEKPGREDSILSVNSEHFAGLLPAAWEAAGITYTRKSDRFSATLPERMKRDLRARWKQREKLGKPLNILRLAKATTTFEGAARYGAWKLERHTGIVLEVTPFRERHPLLAMPGAAWELWRARRNQR
tara:strand:- start:2259 stop:3155 length:897 start_codon:yes stop_codon:yes gene_type:complete